VSRHPADKGLTAIDQPLPQRVDHRGEFSMRSTADAMSAKLAEVRVYIAVIEKDRQIAERRLQEATAWREDCRTLLERALSLLEELAMGAPSLMCSPEQRSAADQLATDINSALKQGQV
jgi:hypothetical protein